MADKPQADAVATVTRADSMAVDAPIVDAAARSLDLEAPVLVEEGMMSTNIGNLSGTKEISSDSMQPHQGRVEEKPSRYFTQVDKSRVAGKKSTNCTQCNKAHGEENKVSKPTTMEDLPNELLSHMFGFLDINRPSEHLLDEPTFDLTAGKARDLKTLCYVSKRWREVIRPILFKHARFVVERRRDETEECNLFTEIKPFLEFVSKNALAKIIKTFVMVMNYRNITGDRYVPENSHDLFATFWRRLFTAIDPVELLIVAHPLLLGSFTSCFVFEGDSWNLDCPCHYLRLRRPSTPPSQPEAIEDRSDEVAAAAATAYSGSNDADAATDTLSEISTAATEGTLDSELEPWESRYPQTSTLFEIRPWSSLLLNEGSFIKAFSTYDFWLRQAPSILSDLLGANNQPSGALISPSIREMSYIGIFPMSSHFSFLTKHFPRLDSLYVQLVPRNNILQNPRKMVQVEMEDLWMERNSCYALLMRELFNAPPVGNYKELQVFESGDAADTDAWNMAVEYVKRAGNGWQVASEGVFVRNPKDLPPKPEEGSKAEDASSFEGALIRWAWNGTAKLPVSAYPLYDNPMGPVN